MMNINNNNIKIKELYSCFEGCAGSGNSLFPGLHKSLVLLDEFPVNGPVHDNVRVLAEAYVGQTFELCCLAWKEIVGIAEKTSSQTQKPERHNTVCTSLSQG